MHKPGHDGCAKLQMPVYRADLQVRESHIASLTGGFSLNLMPMFGCCFFSFNTVYIPLASDYDVLKQIAADR